MSLEIIRARDAAHLWIRQESFGQNAGACLVVSYVQVSEIARFLVQKASAVSLKASRPMHPRYRPNH